MLRHRQGSSQQEVADRAGVSRALLGSYEAERTEPGPKNLSRLLTSLGVDRFGLASALETVNGRPPIAILPSRSQASPEQRELLDLLDLDLAPDEEKVFLGMLYALRDWYASR